MTDSLILVAIVLGLLALRQYILVVLAAVVAYVYLVWGDGRLDNVILDGWDELKTDVLIAIPLYMLAGQLMAEGAMARRLMRVMRALSAPIPGRPRGGDLSVLRHVRGHRRIECGHAAGGRHHHVSGAACRRLQQVVFARASMRRRNAGNHHPTVDSFDSLRRDDHDVDC